MTVTGSERKCPNCGDACQWDYYWTRGKRRWYLAEEDGSPHKCGTRPAKADEFEAE